VSESLCRKVVPVRSAGMCEICGRQPGQSLHHRKPRSQGGKWHPANIVHLCGDGVAGCHGRVTDTRTEYYGRGWLVHRDDEPAAMPFEHWLWGPIFLDDRGDFRREGSGDLPGDPFYC